MVGHDRPLGNGPVRRADGRLRAGGRRPRSSRSGAPVDETHDGRATRRPRIRRPGTGHSAPGPGGGVRGDRRGARHAVRGARGHRARAGSAVRLPPPHGQGRPRPRRRRRAAPEGRAHRPRRPHRHRAPRTQRHRGPVDLPDHGGLRRRLLLARQGTREGCSRRAGRREAPPLRGGHEGGPAHAGSTPPRGPAVRPDTGLQTPDRPTASRPPTAERRPPSDQRCTTEITRTTAIRGR